MSAIKVTPEKKAELGDKVAKLKALLHDAEVRISNNEELQVDWVTVANDCEAMAKQVRSLSDEGAKTEAQPRLMEHPPTKHPEPGSHLSPKTDRK